MCEVGAVRWNAVYFNLNCCRRHKFSIKALLCNNEYFYVVDSDTWLNNAHKRHCCVSTATMVKRMRHIVKLYAESGSVPVKKIYLGPSAPRKGGPAKNLQTN